ncbi:hypothetical protein [Micromonospora coriariae]|uniref:hypothetical protein n=1 Tax=Micromonospora coriariae TaxID=285665 RepID=UPI0012FD517B|nr:hypothetical protein [Micromonospora coriariae]
MIEPESNKEHEFSIELSTPDWLAPIAPALKVGYTHRRQDRGRRFIEDSARHAGVEPGEMLSWSSENELFADAFTAAGEKSIATGDPHLRGALARLVAAAFKDDARIETVSFMISLTTQLEPVHLRILKILEEISNVVNRPKSNTALVKRGAQVPEIAESAAAEWSVVLAALVRLQSMGLVNKSPSGVPETLDQKTILSLLEWQTTNLGVELLALCDEVDAESRES